MISSLIYFNTTAMKMKNNKNCIIKNSIKIFQINKYDIFYIFKINRVL